MNLKNSKNQVNENKTLSTLYKYRCWDNNFHRAILIHNKLYIPSISELNDPFDYQLRLDIPSLNTDEKIEKFINFMIADYEDSETKKLSVQEMENRKKYFKWRIMNEPEKFAEDLALYRQEYFKHFGVLSLSEIWNNILLWTHYSNNHSGFCVGFNKSKLENLKNKFDDIPFFGSNGKVHYCKDYPLIDPIKWNESDHKIILTESHTKSIDWNYESEYRYTKLWFPHIPTLTNRTYQFDDDLIDEVIIGLRISSDNEKEIKEICVKKNIPLYKIQKSNYKFTLDRKEI